MKKIVHLTYLIIGLATITLACSKKDSQPTPTQGTGGKGVVTGKITDINGNPLAGVRVVIEHTTWYNTYVITATDANGLYKAVMPSDPAGSWTAKAQFTKQAYGKEYRFDMHVDNINAFNGTETVTRNFTWKLNGQRPAGGYYGAHIDLYQFGTDAEMTNVKLQLTPIEPKLLDGSNAVVIERKVEDIAGTFMVKDIPIGKYKVKAIYAGKTLLLKNRHDDQPAAIEKIIVFGKEGYLAETEYNIEFWLEE